MIQIVTWLLAFSAGIIGFYATGKITKAQQALLWIGVLVSVIAAFTALLYGGYAARNWAIAVEIAKKNDRVEQLPGYDPFKSSGVPWTAHLPIYWLAGTCETALLPFFGSSFEVPSFL